MLDDLRCNITVTLDTPLTWLDVSNLIQCSYVGLIIFSKQTVFFFYNIFSHFLIKHLMFDYDSPKLIMVIIEA